MLSVESIVNDVIVREGGSKVTNDPNDHGGRTQYGISEKSNPEAWLDGKVTEEEARKIYEHKYVKAQGFDKVKDSKLKTQLIDWGVHSGPQLVIMKLQGIVGAEVDGILGPQTLTAINTMHPDDINTCLAVERIKMIGRIVKKDPSQLKYINGWLDRACQFIL